MPFYTEYEEEGVHFRMTGIITANDMLKIDEILYSDDNFSKLRYLIIDYTHASSFQMSEEEVKLVAEQDLHEVDRNPNLLIVAISSDIKLIDALIMYDTYKGGHPWKSTLSNNLSSAKKWIEENRVQ